MAYRICKSIEVENGHLLSKHPDKCRFPHGHTRKVELIFESEELNSNEMVFDFKLVKHMIEEFIDEYDHALCMNTSDPQFAFFKKTYGDRIIGFENMDPTTEVMAKTIFDYTSQQLEYFRKNPAQDYPINNSVCLKRVRVWETSSSWAEFESNCC